MLFRWALRELRRSWKASLFFVLNLSLGLTGFISLEAYKAALQKHIIENRQEIMAGDLSVSVRRDFTQDEITAINQVMGQAKSSTVYEFFAMASATNSRLVSVKAVDTAYPLYGSVTLEDGRKLQVDQTGVWAAPELLPQLGINVGDHLKIGKLDLVLKGVIAKDTSQTFRRAGLGPRIIFDRSLLEKSGLIQFGSTFSRDQIFLLPAKSPAEIRKFQENLETRLQDPAIQVETADSAASDSNRQMNYLSDFLGLVALVGLFLAGLGAAYLWRLFLQERLKDVAIFRSLGLQGNQAVLLYVIEASLLGVFALIPALLAAQIVLPLLSKILSVVTPYELVPILNPQAIALGFVLALGTSLLVAMPFLLRLRELQPARLFSEEKFNPDLEIHKPWAFLPALALFWALSILEATSIKTGSLFVAVLLAVIAVLAACGWLSLRFLGGFKRGAWELRQGLRSASRRRAASLSVFVALGLGSLLMNLLPQIKATLQNEYAVGNSSKLPSLFMFDLQDDQLESLREIVGHHHADINVTSPLIRSRILKVNGENYERTVDDSSFRTREQERDIRFRNRGVNLSYREKFVDGEELVEGRNFSGRFDPAAGKPAELSLEEAYAERIGMKIGDKVIFDVQGVEVQGEVISLRKIAWLNFQPNFFILIQPGALDDAPKTWIASISKLPEPQKILLQNELAEKLPNVSVIDVARTVTDILGMASQMSWSLEFMAFLAVLTGALVLYSIARTQVLSRRWELNLLKVLGAGSKQVRLYLLAEFAILAGLASALGALLSIFVGGMLTWKIFDLSFSADWKWAVGSTVAITAVGLWVASQASNSVTREKASNIFRDEAN